MLSCTRLAVGARPAVRTVARPGLEPQQKRPLSYIETRLRIGFDLQTGNVPVSSISKVRIVGCPPPWCRPGWSTDRNQIGSPVSHSRRQDSDASSSSQPMCASDPPRSRSRRNRTPPTRPQPSRRGSVVTRRLRAMGIRDKPTAPASPLAEWLCRTADRIEPARVCVPYHCLGQGASAPNPEILCGLTASELIDPWTRMRRFLARFSEPV